MKTKLLLTFLFLTSFLNLTAQEYHPLLNNSYWVVSDWVSCCRPPYVRTIQPGLEATIGPHAYQKFRDPFPMAGVDTVYVREDIVTKKVYRHQESGDVLIYDFSLETGDQITLDSYGPVTFVATVDEVGCNTGTRKRITLNSVTQYNGNTLTQVWIEGVGSPVHPFYPDRNMWNVLSSGGGVAYTTRCGFQGSEHVYGNPGQCGNYLSDEEVELNAAIVFSPNPFSSTLTIASEADLTDATFRLYNLQGQLVREVKNITGRNAVINRDNLSSGLYFAQLSEGSQIRQTTKILVD